ncbi:hypothetical protein ACFQZZ_26235 [Nocardia sp. GCM10030253]|uniref:hypothetical protein n=1 Tax=Nocardia sp. GCM10030253 TaxID=3273404 RepID=UPI00362DA8D3
MKVKPNRSLTILLAGLATAGSLALSGATAAAVTQQDPEPECQVGQTKEEGPLFCECGADGKWICLERKR